MESHLKNREEDLRDDEQEYDFVDDEDITAEWVWEHLKEAFPQVETPWFDDIYWDELGGGKNSDVIRIDLLSEKPIPLGLPRTIIKKRVYTWEIVMECPPIYEDPFEWMAKNEVRFYHEIAPLVDLRFPKIYWAPPEDAKGPFDIFMEDLGEQSDPKTPYWPIEKAKAVIESLAKLHSAMWAPKHLELGWTKRFICKNTPAALLEFCRPVWNDFCTNLFIQKNVRLAARFTLQNPRILDLLLSRPSTIRFYDLRQANVLKNKASEYILVDPALAALGLGVTDILHIIRDTYTTGSRMELEKELLKYYWEHLSPEVRQTYSMEDLNLDRDLSVVESLLARTLIMSMIHPQNRPDISPVPKFLFPLRLVAWGLTKLSSKVKKPLANAKNSQWDWKMFGFTYNFDEYELVRTVDSIERLKKRV